MLCVKTEDSNSSQQDDDYEDEEEEFLPLTDLVRKQYCSYLEKQLFENLASSFKQESDRTRSDKYVQECCRLLEESAIRACMHAPRYRRCMLKIISMVRRNTQECRLENQLQQVILKAASVNKHVPVATVALNSKGTQTEHRLPVVIRQNGVDNASGEEPLSLEQKIERFQARLHQQIATLPKAFHLQPKQRQRHRKVYTQHRSRRHHVSSEGPMRLRHAEKTTPSATSPSHAGIIVMQTAATVESVNKAPQTTTMAHNSLDPDDQIAKELAQLFSEEKTELDELLGIDPNEEPDDPQVCSILKEIESAKLTHELESATTDLAATQTTQPNLVQKQSKHGNDAQQSKKIVSSPHSTYVGQQQVSSTKSAGVNLCHSLWPCELFMQRRRLSASLSHLVEEDFRWLDIMKWKFTTLFGEDSDDEFASCSPSIELDEILIGSCIKRISPWMVKHLMKPMHDGLIANRFLFKKLAKKLAHSIVLECQYPDERIIKRAVEEFFCLHQAVYSLNDLEDIPNMSNIANNSI